MIASSAHSKLTLYDISLEGLMIADILAENEGELTPELEARLDALMQAGPERIEAAAMVVRSIEADADVCKAEAQRLLDRAKGFENNAARLKNRMTIALDYAFNGKVKTPKFTVWAQSSAPTVAVDLREEFTLEMLQRDHPEFVRTKLELDKRAIKEARESGAELPEAIYVEENEGTRYLRIK